MTGVQRYATELLNALDTILENEHKYSQKFNFTCLLPNSKVNISLPDWKNIHLQKCGQLNGNLWEQLELPFFSRKGLLVNLCNIGPLLHFNQIVVFHDASVFAVPYAYSLLFKIKYRVIMQFLGRTARKILTDSQFSKEELSHYLRIKKDKIDVISGGCEHILNILPDYSILDNKELPQIPYLLAVGSLSPHKNLSSAIKAIENFPDSSFNLVIAGGTFSNVFNAVDTTKTNRIIRLGYITDAQLRALYSRAIGFIFPSIYEGFGLPPLEAMTCGCPVLCSNRASLPEVCDDAVLYFNPLDTAEIRNQLNTLINNQEVQVYLKQKGLENAKRFTWKKTAKSLLNFIE